jgi:hypothetical protein
MPNYIIRGTISYPFTAEISTDTIDGFDFADYYGIPRNAVTLRALDEDGLVSDDAVFIVHDTKGDYAIDTIEEA